MADAGDLAKLPAEIRKEVYAHLLVEDKTIPIFRRVAEDKKSNKKRTHGATARMDKLSRPKVPGKRWDCHLRVWIPLPPSTTSLLKVNKLTGLEAAQVLYGFNKFEFQNAGALERFLEQIGYSASHIRHIAIGGFGHLFAGSWVAMDRSIKVLAASKSLRSLEFSHLIFCTAAAAPKLGSFLGTLVGHCKPLLESLRAHFEAQNLNVDVLDFLKSDLPPYPDVSPYRYEASKFGQRNIVTYASCKKRGFDMRPCWCNKPAAGVKNAEFTVELKKEVMRQLGISPE